MTTLYIILGVTILALVALMFLWLYLKKRRGSEGARASAAAGDGGELDQVFREAQAKLAASKLPGGTRIGQLPAFLLLGNTGASKTSVILHSGLETELLSGHLYQNDNVIPTPAVNIWFSSGSLFIEAGGKLLGSADDWKQLVRKMAPGRRVFGSAAQAARAVVVFYDCEAFLQPSPQESAATAARLLRARLGEIAETLGIHLPVYVLFSKMDRLPFFAEYVRNFSNDEACQVLGMTLPMRTGRPGIYAEEETARLTGCFESLFRSLAENRPEFLARENDAGKLPATYEFPREFRKIRPAVVQFLLDLCRPSQLSIGPFLRGFYFTGVRPIIITETAPAKPVAQPASLDVVSGATQFLRTGIPLPSAQAAAASPSVSSRRVPQWMFLARLFHDVLLADRVAQGASAGSIKTNTLRRVLLGSAAGLCLLISIGFTWSFLQNRALEGRVRAAATGVATPIPAGAGLASVDSLRKLDDLRQSLGTLDVYRHEGAPWSYRWWLYSGDALYGPARRVYFARFRQLLLGPTQNNIVENLGRLPAAPGPEYEYGPTYDALKAYLITTSNHDKSTRAFLPPVLLKWWTGNRKVDPERTALAQKQFDFYAGELQEENPFSSDNDAAAVGSARRYLAQFAGTERVYKFILEEANKNNRPLSFSREYPGAAPVAVDPYEVPGAFTKGGWDFVTKDALPHADRYFAGEQWVLGTQERPQIDRAKLEQDLRTRYAADFVKEWSAYIRAAKLVPYTDVKDAAQKLGRITSSDSPLLALFALASQNTVVDDPAVSGPLQPFQAIVPGDSKGRLIAPPNQNYVNALEMLRIPLEKVTGQPDDPVAAQTLTSADQARLAARQVAQSFGPNGDADIKTASAKLLEDPITGVEEKIKGAGPAELNAGGKALCSQFRTLFSKFPFDPRSKSEASLSELNMVFAKPDGALWAFYEKSLQKLLVKQANRYVPAPSATVMLTQKFVDFFNTAAGFSDALYPPGATDPAFTYTVAPGPSEGLQGISLRIDGQTFTYNLGGSATPQKFMWQGSGVHEVKGDLRAGNTEFGWWNPTTGQWSLFHLILGARQRPPKGLEWPVLVGGGQQLTVDGKPVTVRLEIDLAAAAPLLSPASLACVAQVAR
jgi:type VI secretion system protein ImpL